MGSFFGGASSGILQIAIAVLIVWLALKFLKDMAKGFIFAAIGIAAFLVIKGIVDWAMIASIGQSFFEWIKAKIAENSAESANIVINSLNLFVR